MPSPSQETPAEASAGAAPSRSAGPLRFSLRSLIIGVTITAVACMALRYANEIWASVLSTLLQVAVISAMISAIYGDIRQRAWRVGFVITATVLVLYFSLRGLTEIHFNDGSIFHFSPPLAFQHITEWAYFLIHGEEGNYVHEHSGAFGNYPPPLVTDQSTFNPKLADVHHVANPIWILLLSSIGGCFADWLDARRRAAPQSS